jgi:hypothetical protein
MGTSVNQRSPSNDTWNLVQEVYRDPNIGTDEALREIWRAASNTREVNLAALLANPAIGSLAALAVSAVSPSQAYQATTQYISDNKLASLASDIAKRAILQSAGTDNPTGLYFERLFAEATNYLVSRDLPGHITPGGKFENVAAARRFTHAITDAAADAVRRTPTPPTMDGDNWRSFVRAVVSTLTTRTRQA